MPYNIYFSFKSTTNFAVSKYIFSILFGRINENIQNEK